MKSPNVDTKPPDDGRDNPHPEHASIPSERELEARDRQGYATTPQCEEEVRVWENAAVWPEP